MNIFDTKEMREAVLEEDVNKLLGIIYDLDKKNIELETKLKNIEDCGIGSFIEIRRKIKVFLKNLDKAEGFSVNDRETIKTVVDVLSVIITEEEEASSNCCLMCNGVNNSMIYKEALIQILYGYCEGNFCKDIASKALDRVSNPAE